MAGNGISDELLTYRGFAAFDGCAAAGASGLVAREKKSVPSGRVLAAALQCPHGATNSHRGSALDSLGQPSSREAGPAGRTEARRNPGDERS